MDYITSTSNATVDLVKNGAEMLEKLVDGATNLSKVCKRSDVKDCDIIMTTVMKSF
jgi:hypothetical protein